MAIYDIGDLVRCSASFFNNSASLADPDSITFYYKAPGGTTASYVYGTDAELVKAGTGMYYVDYSPSAAGIHYLRWVTTGSVQLAEPDSLTVRPSQT